MEDIEKQRLMYPRVTQIIGIHTADALRTIPLDTLAKACIRGEKVHSACLSHLNNLWNGCLEEEYQPYLDAFIEWSDKHVYDLVENNKRLFDDNKKFTGEFDMIVKMKGSSKKLLLDIKTSCIPSKSWNIQLAAYAHLCRENGIEFQEAAILHLQKKPMRKGQVSAPRVTAKLVTVEDINGYWDIFASALRCYDYFNRGD